MAAGLHDPRQVVLRQLAALESRGSAWVGQYSLKYEPLHARHYSERGDSIIESRGAQPYVASLDVRCLEPFRDLAVEGPEACLLSAARALVESMDPRMRGADEAAICEAAAIWLGQRMRG